MSPLLSPVDVSVSYDRKVLVGVLIYHWPTRTNGCECGWGVLGASYPEHIADVYEAAVAVRTEDMRRHGWVRTEQLRAMVKLLGADEMTPTARRQLLSLCAEND